MQLENDLEPFFSIDITAELCGVAPRTLYQFLERHMPEIVPHYHHDGVGSGRGARVFFRSEIVKIREKMLFKHVNYQDRALDTNTKIYKPRPRRMMRFDKPRASFLLS